MPKIIDTNDVMGQKFNRLTPLAYSHYDSHGDYWYLCECTCGNLKLVRRYHVVSGHTKSCGCLWKENNLRPRGMAGFDGLFNNYRRHARDRSFVFDLTKEQFREITQRNCFYCGKKPSQGKYKNSRNHGNYIHSGIDRVNNNIGYVLNNCVPCCKTCNVAKKDLSLSDFKKWVINIYGHFIGRKNENSDS